MQTLCLADSYIRPNISLDMFALGNMFSLLHLFNIQCAGYRRLATGMICVMESVMQNDCKMACGITCKMASCSWFFCKTEQHLLCCARNMWKIYFVIIYDRSMIEIVPNNFRIVTSYWNYSSKISIVLFDVYLFSSKNVFYGVCAQHFTHSWQQYLSNTLQ